MKANTINRNIIDVIMEYNNNNLLTKVELLPEYKIVNSSGDVWNGFWDEKNLPKWSVDHYRAYPLYTDVEADYALRRMQDLGVEAYIVAIIDHQSKEENDSYQLGDGNKAWNVWKNKNNEYNK